MDKKAPKISVIMPVYNAEKYLKDAIESILNQTYQDFEFLIFDDASTDNSRSIILTYSDPRIKLISSNINQGYLVYLNQGIDLAQGEYIARMDSDDISEPMRFAKQVKILAENIEIGICGTWYTSFNELGNINTVTHPQKHTEIATEMMFHCPIGHPTIMGRKTIFVENKYDLHFYPAEDYEIWSRLVMQTKFYNIPESLLKYRWHNSNISITKAEIQKKHTLEIQTKLWEKQFPHLLSAELELLLEAMLLSETKKSSINTNLLLKIIQRTVIAQKKTNPLFYQISKNRLFHFLVKRISELSNSELIELLFAKYSFCLLNRDLIKIAIKRYLKNIIKRS
jgi:glycosyltransferase involved in cell wall biosynthesis